MPVGTGYPGWITATGEALSTNHLEQDRRFIRQAVKRCGIRTFIGLPLIDDGQSIGYLGMGWKDERIPLDWGEQLLEALRPFATVGAREFARTALVPSAASIATVHCFGSFAISVGTVKLDSSAFPRRKALDLLRHLLLARGDGLSRDTLIERLWPNINPDTGANRLHVALHSLRKVLGRVTPGATESLIQYRHGNYRLDPDVLGQVDAFAFSDALNAARNCQRNEDSQGAIGWLEQAAALYKGDLFADAEDLAFEAQRQNFRERHREALRQLVDLYVRDDRTDAAIATVFEARERAVFEDTDWCESLLRSLAYSY